MGVIDIFFSFTFRVQLLSHLAVTIRFDTKSTNKELQNETNPSSVAQFV